MQPILGDVVEVQTVNDQGYVPRFGRVMDFVGDYVVVSVDGIRNWWLVDHVEVVDR